jgi:hypothetical protein
VNKLHEIQRVVATLAAGDAPEPGACRHWTGLHLDLVRSHRLGPWLYKSFRDHPAAGLNAEILEELHEDYRISVVACMSRDARLSKLLDAFSQRELPVLLLKGAYLGRFVYKDPALRVMSDVDILVRDQDFARCRHELEWLGYSFIEEPDYRYHQHLKMPVTYVRSGNLFDVVDLHSTVRSMDYYSFPSSFLWSEATESDLQGRRVSYLSPELNFIHLAVHNLNHVGLLRDWVDLILLLRSLKFDWERLLYCGRSLGVLRPLFWIFRELQETWNSGPPVAVTSELSRYVPSWIEDRVIRHRFRYLWRLSARIASFDSWSARLRYLQLKLLASPSEVAPARGTVRRLARLKEKLDLFLHFWNRG